MTVHVIGAGLAGLAAATRVVERGGHVRLYEAARHAGGRCRSWHDDQLDRLIDNGSHLIIGAYSETFRYGRRMGAERSLEPVRPIRYAMCDPARNRFWTLGANWQFLASGMALGLVADMLRLALSRSHHILAERLPDGPRMVDFWAPLSLAIFNTPPVQASARMMWRVLVQAAFGGTRPYLAPNGLSEALVETAVQWLSTRGEAPLFGHRLGALDDDGQRIRGLDFGKRLVALAAGDQVILALPNAATRRLIGPSVPALDSAPIVNIHYRIDGGVRLPDGAPFVGLVGTQAQWLFARGDILSVTVSAAQSLAEMPNEWIAAEIWREIHDLAGLPADLPPWRVIKERAATIIQGPEEDSRRPGPDSPFANLFLAGDWIQTGLPATIESAVLSGHQAADLCFPG